MDMFTNYQNLNPSYIPDNMSSIAKTPFSYTKLCTAEHTKPYELYNAKGELEGYYWYYKNTIILDFLIDGEVLDIDGNGTGEYVSADEYLMDKTATLTIFDFRMQPIHQVNKAAKPELSFEINTELSERMLRGIYYCSLDISNSKSHETIFSANDCKFLVK